MSFRAHGTMSSDYGTFVPENVRKFGKMMPVKNFKFPSAIKGLYTVVQLTVVHCCSKDVTFSFNII